MAGGGGALDIIVKCEGFCVSLVLISYGCVNVFFFRTHMQNIKDITSSIHYEMYRVRRLNENNTVVTHANGIPEHHLAAHEM